MNPTGRLWLDSASTTPLAVEVAEAMAPWLRAGAAGNPSSLHAEGRAARRAVEDVRDWFAEHFRVPRGQVHFTGSATEANNLALAGALRALAPGRPARPRVLASAIEHDSVRQCLAALARENSIDVAWCAAGLDGAVDLTSAREMLGPGVALASLMHVNNETGAIQPIERWGEMIRAANPAAIVHCDAAQSFHRLDLPMEAADLWVLCAHKMHGPPGAGVLIRCRPVELRAHTHGGPQEGGVRAGTENVAAIVGLGCAARLAVARRGETAAHLRALAGEFLGALRREGVRFEERIAPAVRAPGMLSLTFEGISSEDLVIAADLDGVSLSAGSACHSGVPEPSHVLAAMGIEGEVAGRTVRAVFHRDQTREEARLAAERLAAITRRAQE